ncbi:MAG TPA: 1-acyl-sn-glycerol-3-phosphate acyltransferase [Sunxiuqinia sp.]|nr:1-acyl-sn-glycerol-3-phosphate acyltransferase [Sunxiuqinia sp.]
MEKWSLGYAILKLVVRFSFWMSHKRIVVRGKENIPKGVPIIFAANHQNALMDPLAVLCTNNSQPVWLARADIFKNKRLRPILRFLKILPVYRIRDGKSSLGRNEAIFKQAIEILEKKKVLALFPEAAHSEKRQMLTHKKAVPRIAFQAEEKNDFKLHLQVVPVGIFYSHYWHFNRKLIVQYGQPILVDNYQDEYETNPLQATLMLRDEIRNRLESLTIEISSNNHYNNYELFREIIRSDFTTAIHRNKNKTFNRFLNDQQLMKILEEREKTAPEEFEVIHPRADEYRNLLDRHHLNLHAVNKKNKNPEHLFLRFVATILISPFLIAGFLLHGIPFLIPRFYTRKHVKEAAFYCSFQFVTGMIAYLIFCLIIAVTTFYFSENILLPIVAVSAYLLFGKIVYLISQFSQKTIDQFRLFIFSKKNQPTAKRLLKLKDLLIKSIDRQITTGDQLD